MLLMMYHKPHLIRDENMMMAGASE